MNMSVLYRANFRALLTIQFETVCDAAKGVVIRDDFSDCLENRSTLRAENVGDIRHDSPQNAPS